MNVQYTIAGIAAGDINEDGKQDLIVSASGSSQMNYILLSKGDGTFTVSGTMPNSYGFLQGVFVDLNGDKHLDFVCAGNPQTYAWLGDGKGNFTPKPIQNQPADGTLPALTVADFNRDDKLDLMVADYGNPSAGIAGSLQFFPGVGDGTFGAPLLNKPFSRSGGYSYLTAADFNGDGKLDIAFSLPTIAAIAFGNGDGTFQFGQTQMTYPPQGPANSSSTVTAALPLAAADFDGNGTSDIAIVTPVDNHLVVSLNDGTGTFAQANPDFQANIDANTFFVLTADLNGDGLPDIITGSYTTNNVAIFLSKRVKTTPVVTLSISATQVIPGTAITLAAKIAGTNGIPTGAVTFADGSTSLGQVALDANGQAMFTTSSLGAGQHSLTATYAGDTRFNGTASSAVVTSVVDFSLSLGTASQTIASGGTAGYPLTLTTSGAFTGPVTLTCSGLPTGYSCSSTAVSLGAQPVTSTVTVATATHAMRRPGDNPFPFGSGVYVALLPVGFWIAIPRRRRWSAAGAICSLALTVGCFWLGGCSGGSSAPISTGPAPYRGTSQFTISAAVQVGSQTLSHQTPATLTVQ
ncbi:FG-GAP-like repeat-containing protein [Terriglobus sp.]|uniref:FG-GAP-like repeat-containing protein n=1 Tax=Terriglobus sp. TaxID=1889013 RepID=UPI003B00D738